MKWIAGLPSSPARAFSRAHTKATALTLGVLLLFIAVAQPVDAATTPRGGGTECDAPGGIQFNCTQTQCNYEREDGTCAQSQYWDCDIYADFLDSEAGCIN